MTENIVSDGCTKSRRQQGTHEGVFIESTIAIRFMNSGIRIQEHTLDPRNRNHPLHHRQIRRQTF
jgi:hypothetical protein